MTTLFLSTIGGSVGAAALGTIGQFAGAELGTYVGARLDSLMFGLDKTLPAVHAPRLNDLNIQTSTYGKVIPIIYGYAKISGNIIWALPLQEVMEKNSTTVGKWGPRTTRIQINYSYYATVAIAICTGVVNELINIYANEQLVDTNAIKYRFYAGTEDQQPDHLIQTLEGHAPAYRGISYIVLEDFPLAEYGNRIPNFTFEVSCNMSSEVADKIKSINIIPGSGEFVYDTNIQSKSSGQFIDNKWISAGMATRINQNSNKNVADAIVSLDHLQKTLPKVQWVSVVVNWFADNLDIAKCSIYPAVEYKEGARAIPDDWQVAAIKRSQAPIISKDLLGNPIYGGTINDTSLLSYLQELKKRGYKIMLYPMLLLDIHNKPWRGYMKGEIPSIENFFKKYNTFIEHYATLGKDWIDAFIIGSELKGITQINHQGKYPAVIELVKLAKAIKQIVNANTVVTYAADWSEYHSHNGIYYLDGLWTSPYIDVVGIDAYFPLTDSPQPPFGFSCAEIIKGWTSGEGYDYYYQDNTQRTKKVKFSDARWAWKNIKEWWEGKHFNSDWQPKMKKIWFTEYGFPSVDGCTNQPNVFIDKHSQDSQLPFYSQGNITFKAQAMAIAATIDYWQTSTMVENMFLWAWDARPFPYFPGLPKLWADCASWQTGHWIQGKVFFSTLGNIIDVLLKKAGYSSNEFFCDTLMQMVDGFILNERYTAQSAIDILRQVYFFDVVQRDKKLLFIPNNSKVKLSVDVNDLVVANNFTSITHMKDALQIPGKVEMIYLNRQYEICSTYAERMQITHQKVKTIFLPMILDDHYANKICEVMLYQLWQSRISCTFNLPMSLAYIKPTDLIKINGKIVKITNIDYGEVMHINAKYHDNDIYKISAKQLGKYSAPTKGFSGSTIFEILDLPTNSEGVSICKNGMEHDWKGAALYTANDNSDDFQPLINMYDNSTNGHTINKLLDGSVFIIDEGNEIVILLRSGTLESITDDALLNGGNLALIGNEIIQFRDAELIGDYKYKLSGLLRGRYSTEHITKHHQEGERFILLDDTLVSLPMSEQMLGKKNLYKAISYGEITGEIKAFIYHNNYLKPFSVVYISAEADMSAKANTSVKANTSTDISGNIKINWCRRSRIDSNLSDYIEVPLAEEFEKYDLEIYKQEKVVRTTSISNDTSYIYSAEEQIADFGIIQKNIDIKIYQLSAMVGRGISERVNINI